VQQGAGFAEFGEEEGFWGGLEKDGEVVAEDAGDDLEFVRRWWCLEMLGREEEEDVP